METCASCKYWDEMEIYHSLFGWGKCRRLVISDNEAIVIQSCGEKQAITNSDFCCVFFEHSLGKPFYIVKREKGWALKSYVSPKTFPTYYHPLHQRLFNLETARALANWLNELWGERDEQD